MPHVAALHPADVCACARVFHNVEEIAPMSRDTIDKVDVAKRIAAVKRWTRNGDILELCDVLEHVMKCWQPIGANLSRDKAAKLSRDMVSSDPTVSAAGCPECAARRASDLARQRRQRAKRKAA